MYVFSITKRNAKLPIPFPNCTIPNPPFQTKIHRRITNSMERNHLYRWNWSNFHSINSNSMLRASNLNRRKIPRKKTKKRHSIRNLFLIESHETGREWRRRSLVSYPNILFATFNRIEFHNHCPFKNVRSLNSRPVIFTPMTAAILIWPHHLSRDQRANHRRETIRGAD